MAIISPLVTEKGTIVSEKANQVVFRIRPAASKDQGSDGNRRSVQGYRGDGPHIWAPRLRKL
jgi:hypothetical protein